MEKEIDKLISKFREITKDKCATIFIIRAASDTFEEVIYAPTVHDASHFLENNIKNYKWIEIRKVAVAYITASRLSVYENGTKIDVVRTVGFNFEVYESPKEPVKDEYGCELKLYDFVRMPNCSDTFEIQYINRGMLFLRGNSGVEFEITPDKVYKV